MNLREWVYFSKIINFNGVPGSCGWVSSTSAQPGRVLLKRAKKVVCKEMKEYRSKVYKFVKSECEDDELTEDEI